MVECGFLLGSVSAEGVEMVGGVDLAGKLACAGKWWQLARVKGQGWLAAQTRVWEVVG